MTTAILIYIFAINAVTFIVYGIDKYKAKHDKWAYPKLHCSCLPSFAAASGLGVV